MLYMAVRKYAENDRRITKELDADFYYLLQNAVLLALKEDGQINEIQYRIAEDHLKAQRRELATQ